MCLICASVGQGVRLEYAKCLQLIRLPMLVYDYNKLFVYNTTNQIKNPTKILSGISDYAPNGEVVLFVDDRSTGLQAGITKSSKQQRICVVFRGSEERLDWYHNSLFQKRRVDRVGSYVHTGFYKQLHDNHSYDKLTEVLRREMEAHPHYEVFVMGHSLGGALATLYGYHISKQTPRPITIISFASPRIGNYQFKKEFERCSNLHHYRFTNKRDIVPAFPMIRYHHVGEHIHMNGKRFMKGHGNSLFSSWSVKDHDIDSYYASLKKGKGWDAL
jgi:hypothetical protein